MHKCKLVHVNHDSGGWFHKYLIVEVLTIMKNFVIIEVYESLFYFFHCLLYDTLSITKTM
jgi:hypothetical protein